MQGATVSLMLLLSQAKHWLHELHAIRVMLNLKLNSFGIDYICIYFILDYIAYT